MSGKPKRDGAIFCLQKCRAEKCISLYTVFKDKQSHKIHLEGNDPKWFFEQMEENNYNFQGQWVAGIEIESSEGQVLN